MTFAAVRLHPLLWSDLYDVEEIEHPQTQSEEGGSCAYTPGRLLLVRLQRKNILGSRLKSLTAKHIVLLYMTLSVCAYTYHTY